MRTSLSKPFSAKAKFLMLIMAFLFTLLLTACGSSSSSSSATSTPDVVNRPIPDVSASGAELEETSRARRATAPILGVVQSTNVDSSVSQDDFDVILTTDGDDNEVIRFNHADATGGVGVITVDFQFSDAVYHTTMSVVEAGIDFGSSHPSVSFTEINNYEELGDDGYLWTDIYISNLGPTQEEIADEDGIGWLLGGVWLYTPKSGTAEDYEIGAFVAVHSSYSQVIDNDQEADAVYRGVATGTFLAGKNAAGWTGGGWFDAKAALTATFTSGDGGDTIAGSIFDFNITDPYGSAFTGDADELVLQLESAEIGADGFYEDTTTSNDSHTGFWGGALFDTEGSTTNTPETAGGTFSVTNAGVTTNDEDNSVFVGAFITTRD